jgi:hypothetical protein
MPLSITGLLLTRTMVCFDEPANVSLERGPPSYLPAKFWTI